MASTDITAGPPPSPVALNGLARLSPWRQAALLAGLAASIALGVAVVLWARTPAESLLFPSLSPKEVTSVLDALQADGIKFRIDETSGAVMVPASHVREARIKLAAQGLPRSAAPGFEILDQNPRFGTSEFLERARFQRALEVELARSISEFNNIRSARVHLAVPRQSSFVRARESATASVLVNLYPGRELERSQAKTIAHMVAAAVPRMEPGAVRVVDDRGHLVNPAEPADGRGISDREFERMREVESAYVQRVESILDPLLGRRAYRAQVAVDMDFTRTEETRESFTPDPGAMRSELVVNEESDARAALGVPGALSNQPPAAASSPERTGRDDPLAERVDERLEADRRGGTSRQRRTRNFELDRTVSHVRGQVGTLRRISAAIVVDDASTAGEDGATVRQARSDEEIARITELAKKALGFDEERGDSIVVVNAKFTETPPLEALPEPPLWEQPWVWDVARQAGAVLLVLLLVFGVLRPMMRTLAHREDLERQLAARLEAPSDGGEDGAGRGRAAALPGPASGADPFAAALPDQRGIHAVKSLVEQDPKRVASVVKNWVREDE